MFYREEIPFCPSRSTLSSFRPETGAQVWADRLEGERSKLGQTALRLSPHDDQASSWQLRLCYFHNLLAQWEQGIEWCEKAVVNNHDQWYAQAVAALA
jgi:hypothetical protein